jgi:hypothetical protein
MTPKSGAGNEMGPANVLREVGLRRSDLGLALSALAAAGLIGVFFGVTEGDSVDETPSSTTLTAPAVGPGRPVRMRSPQVPELAWSRARGEFRLECRRGRPTRLEARITSLPAERRYAWRVITGDANQTAPLTARHGMTASLLVGEGLPSAFAPVDRMATVRFTFAGQPGDLRLGLNVLGIDRFRSFVIATPPMTCRR